MNARRYSLDRLIAVAESLGFTEATCVHPEPGHYVFDRSHPYRDGVRMTFLRLHIRHRRHCGRIHAIVHVAGTYPHARGAYTMEAAAQWMREAVEFLASLEGDR